MIKGNIFILMVPITLISREIILFFYYLMSDDNIGFS